MNETEIKNLLAIYQKRVSDFLSQSIALEARTLTLSQEIESLRKQISEQETLIQSLKQKSTTKRSSKTEEF